MAVLVTGGTGYIGSHTVIELIEQGKEVIIIDNLSNSSIEIIGKIELITGEKVRYYEIDIRNKIDLNEVFKKHEISSVIHFAGLKAVGESNEIPIEYYYTNVVGTLNLCQVMEQNNVYNLIFSSSATVYGIPEKLPLTEDSKIDAINPYGRTKLMCEDILKDIANANEKWKITLLRYFNPVGAHESGLIGEEPNGRPNNLMPYVTKVAVGELGCVNVFGDDYPTKDGTGVRDYIHVVDLANGHIAALDYLQKQTGIEIFNLGTGKGYSVLEIIQAFESYSGIEIPYKIKDRRPGDAATSYADPSRANNILKWIAKKDLKDICTDIWKWKMKEHASNKGELN